MINKKEAYIALFTMIVAICNIFFLIFKASNDITYAFSLAMSVAVIYFAWRELETLDIIKQIRTIILLNSIEKNVDKALVEAMEAVKNAPDPWKESQDK